MAYENKFITVQYPVNNTLIKTKIVSTSVEVTNVSSVKKLSYFALTRSKLYKFRGKKIKRKFS